jgi:hypothetical protein
MKNRTGLSLSFALVTCLCLAACNQGGPNNQSLSSQNPAGGVLHTTATQALVLYAAGDVSVTAADGWAPVTVGDLLARGQSVRTGAKAVCELQFGGRAAVRIEEKTEVVLDTISIRDNETDIGLSTTAGTMLCKVEKLAGTERFRVRTPTAVCGVKGTEFGVIVGVMSGTVLAVREGRVAIRPAPLDLDKLAAEAKSGDADVTAALGELDQAEQIVAAGQTGAVSVAAAAMAQKTFAGAQSALDRINEVKEPSAAEKDKFRAAIRKAKAEMQTLVAAPRPQSDEQKNLLKRIDGLKKRLIDVTPAGQTDMRFRVSLSVKPEDAEIFLGNESVGFGRFQGLFEEGEKLEFRATKSGFTSQTLSVTASAELKPAYEISLEAVLAETAGAIDLLSSGIVTTRDGQDRTIEVTLGRQEALIPPGALGMESMPNGAVTLLGRNPYRLMIPMWGDTFVVEGDDIRHWNKNTQVFTKGGKGAFDNGGAYIEGVYRHSDGLLFGFYMAYDNEGFEGEATIPSEQYTKWYGRIGAAESADGGLTWKRQGPVLESNKPKQWKKYEGQGMRGLSDASVVTDLNGRYLYLFFCENSRVNSQIYIGVARADIRAGAPLAGAWKKYYQGAFSEDGLGGRSTPVMDATAMNLGDVEQPYVFYCRSLGRYVMIFVINFWKEYQENQGLKNTGVFVSYSADAINWSTPYRLLKTFVVPLEGKEFVWYPSFIPDANLGTDGWLVYAYSEKFGDRAKGLVPYYMAGRRISLKVK